MSSTSDLPKISKADPGKRKPSTAGSLKSGRKQSMRNPTPPKAGVPVKSPRKASRIQISASEDEKSVSSVNSSPETKKERLQSIKPKPVPPKGPPSRKGTKKKNSTLGTGIDNISLLSSKSASGATKADVIVDMFQQNVAAWKIRFFIEVVIRKNQSAKFTEERSTWKKQMKVLHKKYTDAKVEISKLKAEGTTNPAPINQAAAAAAAISKAESSRVGELEAELIALRAEKRELKAKLDRSETKFEQAEKRSAHMTPSDNQTAESSTVESLREELDLSRTKLYDMAQEKNAIILELEKKNLADNSMEAKLTQANETIKLLGDALQEFKTRSSVFDQAARAKSSENDNMIQELEEATKKIKALEIERDELTVRTEKSSSERRSLERLVTEITVNMHSREKRVAEFKAEAESKNKLIDDMTFKLNNHKVEMDMMAKRVVNSEAIQRNAQVALIKSRLSEERVLMRNADLEGQVAKLLKTISSAKQYAELLEEQVSTTKKKSVEFEREVHSKLAAAQKAAEESEKAATAYLQGSLSQRGSVSFPTVSMMAPDDEMNDADYSLDELEYQVSSRVMNGSVRSAGNKMGSPFPSGRTYGLPNYVSPARGSTRGGIGPADSFAPNATQASSVAEERLVALVTVLENRIDKIDYMTQLMEEENLGDEDVEDDILMSTLESEKDDPVLEAHRLELENAEESKKKKAEEKLSVLYDHKIVLQKQEVAMMEKVALAQKALDQKKMELAEIKGDLSELQIKMTKMEETNLQMLSELQAWEDEVIATSGVPPTDEERLERAAKLLEGDKQLQHSFELTQEVAKEIVSVDEEVTKLEDTLNALTLQKDVLTTLLVDHEKLEQSVRDEIAAMDEASAARRVEALKKAEARAEKKKEIDEKVAARERKRKILQEKRAARAEKLNSFKKVEIPAVLSQTFASEKKEERNSMSAMAKSLPEDRYGTSKEERDITNMANNVHHVGDRISDLLASINNISFSNSENVGLSVGGSVRNPVHFQSNRDEDVYFHYAGADDGSAFEGSDYPQADPHDLALIDRGNVSRHPQQLRAYERVNEYDRASTSPFDYCENPQEMADQMVGLHEHLKGLAYQVGECRLCLDRVTYHIKPKRLDSIQNWAAAFEEQWGRRPGPADCRSAGSWPLIEAYIRTQRKEYEMYLEIQSLCNEGRFQLKTLQTMQTNYKMLLKSVVSQGKDMPMSSLAAHYDESKLPVTSDDIYELHAAFAPLLPSVFDDPVKSLFAGGEGTAKSGIVVAHNSIAQSSYYSAPQEQIKQDTIAIKQIYPTPYDPKESVFSSRAGDIDMFSASLAVPESLDDGLINLSLSLEDNGGSLGRINENSSLSGQSVDTATKNIQHDAKEEKKKKIRSHIDDITGPPPEEVALDELYNAVEDVQGELDEALSLLQEAKEEYRRQLSRQEFATRELEAWEIAFCQKNPGKIPGQLNEDEKRFGGGGALYDTLEKQIHESETQRRRVEALVDIAVEKQLLVDDKTEELRSLQAKYAEISRQKGARGNSSLTKNSGLSSQAQKLIAAAPAHGVIRATGATLNGPRRMSLQDMVVLDAGTAGWQQARDDVVSEIGRIKSEISVVETFIGPCEDSLEQFKKRKKKLKQIASYWIEEYKKAHNNQEPTEEEKRKEIGPIYAERAEIQVREQLLNSQREQALEILEKLNKVLEQKETRLNLIMSNLSPQ